MECTNVDAWRSFIICWHCKDRWFYNNTIHCSTINKFKEWAFAFCILYSVSEGEIDRWKIVALPNWFAFTWIQFRIEFIMHKQNFIDKTEYFSSNMVCSVRNIGYWLYAYWISTNDYRWNGVHVFSCLRRICRCITRDCNSIASKSG